jgi:hypothetical protein
VFVIAFRRGAPITIDNAHFKGVGEFEGHSAAYSQFVCAAVAQVARQASGALAGLAVSMLLLPLPSCGFIALRLVLIAAMLPVFCRWIVRARPRGVALDPAAFVQGLPNTA